MQYAIDKYYADPQSTEVFQYLLETACQETGSLIGLIGDVHYDARGPYLKIMEVSEHLSNAADPFFAAFRDVELHNLNSLIGYTLRTQQMLLTDDPAAHEEANGLPPGHPGINCYLGLPVLCPEGRLTGILALANGDFTAETPALLEPLLRMAGLLLKHRTTTANFRSFHSLYTAIVDQTTDGILSIDDSGLIVAANPAIEQLLGYEQKTLEGEPLLDVIPERYRDRHSRALDQHLAAREALKPVEKSFSALTRDGREIEFRFLVRQTQIDGRTYFTAFVPDTRKIQADIDRKTSEAHFEQLLETANAPIWGVDVSGRVDTWNFSAELLSGYSRLDAMGMDLVDTLILPEEKALAHDIISKALSGIESSSVELNLVSKDGRRKTLLTSATTRRSPDGKPIGVIGVAQDVTEMRSREALYQNARRTEALGTLTGGVAHSYNNLLTIIEGNLRFLLQDFNQRVDSGDPRELLQDAISAAKEASKLTRSLTSYSGSLRLIHEDIVLEDFLNAFVLDTADEFGVRWPVILTGDVRDIVLQTCPNTMQTALIELCRNAREAMPGGGNIIIHSRTCRAPDGFTGQHQGADSFLEITVTDSGEGIDSQNLNLVSDPFFTTKAEHAGLGLSMAAGFAKQAGGNLVVKSIPGAGTKAYLYLPRL